MANITSYGRADSLVAGEVLVPLVVLKKSENSYAGFIPGFIMKNIMENTAEECFAKLKIYLTQKLRILKETGEPMPFFPDRKEIMNDFENVHQIQFIKIVSSKNN